MKNICGIFDNRDRAETAVTELLAAGIPQGQISLIMSDATRNRMFVVGRDEAGEAAKGAVEGAAVGGSFGAIIAGLTAVAAFAVPGVAILVAGPLVAAAAGGAAGATVGGLVGALASAGMPEEEAKKYEMEIRNGKALLVIHPENDRQAMVARTVLIDTGAVQTA